MCWLSVVGGAWRDPLSATAIRDRPGVRNRMIETHLVEWAEGRAVTVRVIEGERTPSVLLAHGAGVDQDHPMQVAVRDAIAEAGFTVATFNYPYKEEGRGGPDRPPRLLACHRAVADWITERFGRSLVLAGRSMGGRMGTMLAAEGYPTIGVVALAYPLHPAGKPERLRVEHLPAIGVPVLMVIGDRDPLCTLDLYDRHVRELQGITTHVVADGDHSFRVRKKSGRTNEDAFAGVISAVVGFLDEIT